MSEIRISDALQALRPNSEYSVTGDAYSGVNWLDKSQTQPTEEEINAKIAELKAAEPYKLLREERNKLIAETDWTQNRDVTLSNDADWKTYIQSLRDITKTYKTLDTVKWPTEPTS